MSKTRIILIAVSVLLIAALFFLPKAVVENDSQLQGESAEENSPAGAGKSPQRNAAVPPQGH
jgi:hypothetical protein